MPVTTTYPATADAGTVSDCESACAAERSNWNVNDSRVANGEVNGTCTFIADDLGGRSTVACTVMLREKSGVY